MKCRTMVRKDGVDNIVWFGSYGIDENGKAIKANPDESQVDSSFSTDLDAVADTFTQQLSVMRGELWHSMLFGLFEKVKSKALIDAAIANIIMGQPEVLDILNFSSSVYQKEYHCELTIKTIFGNTSISI